MTSEDTYLAERLADIERGVWGAKTEVKVICGLAAARIRKFQSLSQEAVRDEVLREENELLKKALANFSLPSNTTYPSRVAANNVHKFVLQLAKAYERALILLIATQRAYVADALKREPNAAAWDRSTERASGERTSAGTSPSPAPAAPVAKMVKRLEDYAKHMKGSTEFPYGEGDLSRAAALLAKLGQGWVPETIWLCSNGDGAKHAFLKDPSGPCPFCQKNGKGNRSVYPLPLLGTPGASDD